MDTNISTCKKKKSQEKLTQERLKEILNYDPETGIFTWNVNKSQRSKTGDVAGSPTSKGYISISINYRQYQAHRLAWLWMEGFFPKSIEIDHRDRNKKNNKFNNLRLATSQCNARNRNIREDNSSNITGVSWNKKRKKWVAYINATKKRCYLGCFGDILDAAKARWDAENKHNFQDCNTQSSAYLYLKTKGMINF